ncbi:SLATT domain-containing protein [Flavobacterium mesophilum]
MNRSELLLLDWMRKIHQLEYAHCYQSLFYAKLEKWVGISSFVLTTTVAFTYRFPFISYPWVKEWILPLIAFIVAILSAYQAFIKPSEKSETHRKLGLQYEKIRHEIESVYLLAKDEEHPELETKKTVIKGKWDALDTLYVNECYFKKAKDKVNSFKKYPKELDFIPDRK